MKKQFLLMLCCSLILLSGCTNTKYPRIHFNNEILGENVANYIDEDTSVTIQAEEAFPDQLPMYKITKREISRHEYQQMLQQLGLAEDPSNPYDRFELDGNQVLCNLTSYTDFSRGYFSMAEDKLEKLAWETFEKIPFMEGKFEYLGIRDVMRVNDSTGDHIARVGVSFRRLLDDVRVVGEEKCMLYFDGSGLVEVQIALFNYEKVGMMDVVPLESAAAKIKTPDDFTIEPENPYEANIADMLRVEKMKLLLVNQHSEGCTILQPIYHFMGTAVLEDGAQAEFSSTVIAIPETYTYEASG